MQRIRHQPTFVLLAALLVTVPACGAREAQVSARDMAGASAPSDAPLSTGRVRLLELAFECASAIPDAPHRKTRARTQEEVLAIALELGQARLVSTSVERIDNWRRGVVQAELAAYCAEHGPESAVEPYLARAEAEAARCAALLGGPEPEDQVFESPQDWHRERILGQIARLRAVRGEDAEAARLEQGASDAESGHAALGRAERLGPDEIEPQLASLREAARIGNFELARGALAVVARLHARFYEQAELRTRLEQEIRAGWRPVPLPERLEVLGTLVESALEHADTAHARELLAEARTALAGGNWEPDGRLPFDARLAGLRHRAGETAEARADLETGLAFYMAERAKLVDIFRADALRPLAETFALVGDAARASELYGRALGEGLVNPNACPRAEDLIATALSMARVGFEPDAALWKRLEEARTGLVAPW
ncbi:MAG: hypothetical protein ABL998_08330 [Planctomycetota bacterium]